MTNDRTFEGLPEIIRTIVQSDQMADILKGYGIGAPTEEEAHKEKPGEPEPSTPGDGFSIPPELMEKLPQIVSALRDSGISPPQQTTHEPAEATPAQQMPPIGDIAAKLPQVMEALSGMGRGTAAGKTSAPSPTSRDQRNRKALLSALKPYMNDRKRSAIDTMLSIDDMAEILKLMMGGKNVL